MIGLCDYTTQAVPAGYLCAQCGATHCKLWRQYNTFGPDLLCAECAAGDQAVDISDMDSDGRYPSTLLPGHHRIDQIGWLIPAVPTEEGGAYWGYTSVPELGCAWWRRLPNAEDKAYVALRWARDSLDRAITDGMQIMDEWRDWLEQQVRPLL